MNRKVYKNLSHLNSNQERYDVNMWKIYTATFISAISKIRIRCIKSD